MEQIEQAAWAKDRYVLSETWLLQMYRRLRPHWLIVLGIALGCPVLVYCATKILWRAIWSLVTGAVFLEGVSMWLSVALLLAYIAVFVWLLFGPRRKAKRVARRAQELFGAMPDLSIAFYGDAVTVRVTGQDACIRLDNSAFVKCIETQDLFLLMTKEGQPLPVVKQGLTEIGAEEFRTVIGYRCVNLKQKRRKTV